MINIRGQWRRANSPLCQLLNALWAARDGQAREVCGVYVLRPSLLPAVHTPAAQANTHHCWTDNSTQGPDMCC